MNTQEKKFKKKVESSTIFKNGRQDLKQFLQTVFAESFYPIPKVGEFWKYFNFNTIYKRVSDEKARRYHRILDRSYFYSVRGKHGRTVYSCNIRTPIEIVKPDDSRIK